MSNRPRRCECTVVAAAAPKGAARFVEWPGLSVANLPATRNPGIDGDVDDNDRGPEHELDVLRQPAEINNLDGVVLDEAFRVLAPRQRFKCGQSRRRSSKSDSAEFKAWQIGRS